MRVTRWLVGALGFVAFLPPAAAEEAVPLRRYESAHYELFTNETPAFATDALAALEAAWPQMKVFFGAEPRLKKGARLCVKHVITRTQWEQVMRADGVRPPLAGGGYYAPGPRVAYVYRQPTVYNTRQLLLHEAMHQFHFLACCNNVGPKDTWYTEGLVEHLSRHTWDGKTLRLGVVPTVSLANAPKEARRALLHGNFDLEALVAGTRPFSRPEAWALVRFLATSEHVPAKRWKKLRGLLDGGRTAAKVFARVVALPDRLLPDLRAWIQSQQEPWVWIWNEWQALGPDALEGWAKVTSAAHVRADVSRVSCRIDFPVQGPWKIGLLLHYVDSRDYTVALVTSGGLWTVNRRVGTRWQVLKRGPLERPLPDRFRVRATRDGENVAFAVEERVVFTGALPAGKMGVALENCRARFLELDWR